ncbi:hypothetical protein HKBW3S42_01132, partial [Candidatus Hakubella thermalkaliphila]
MNLIEKVIHDVVRSEIQDKPILIWYDDGSTLIDVLPKVDFANIRLLPFAGSYLAIRAKIERQDPEFKQKWLIYVPEKALAPSWLRDCELFGTRVDLNLERLLVEHVGLRSNAEIKKLVAASRGRALAANWENAMGKINPPLTKEQIEKGLLAVAFGVGPTFDLGRAILEYVSDPDTYSTELARMGLNDVFTQMIQRELGFSLPADKQLSAENLAAAILFSELVEHSGGLGKQEFQALLPYANRRSLWADLADQWWQHTRLRAGFLKWSHELEKKYNVKGKLAGIDCLINVTSFQAVDEILLDELCVRLCDGNVKTFAEQASTIEKVATMRGKAVWAETGKFTAWKSVDSAVRLFSKSEAALEDLKRISNGLVKEYLDSYYADEGWWEVDELYRGLGAIEKTQDDRIQNLFVRPAAAIYGKWLREVGVKFSDAVSKLSAWEVEGMLGQADFWETFVAGSEEPVAVLMVDALRFDLCRSLWKRLSSQGLEVNLSPMLAFLPSITEIGMAALMPRAGRSLHIDVEEGKLRISLDGSPPLNDKSAREKLVMDLLGPETPILELKKVTELSEQELRSQLYGGRRMIITYREVDRAGTFLPDVRIDLFEALIEPVVETVCKLHQTGFERILITTDHGFILLPTDFEVDV